MVTEICRVIKDLLNITILELEIKQIDKKFPRDVEDMFYFFLQKKINGESVITLEEVAKYFPYMNERLTRKDEIRRDLNRIRNRPR